MVVVPVQIFCHLLLKGKHSLHIHIVGSGNEIFFIGIFRRQTVCYQMATVIQKRWVRVNQSLILCLPPAGRLHTANLSSFSGGHQLPAHVGKCHAAPSQIVQLAVRLKGVRGFFFFRKKRNIVIDTNVGLSRIFRNGEAVRDAGVILLFRFPDTAGNFLRNLPDNLLNRGSAGCRTKCADCRKDYNGYSVFPFPFEILHFPVPCHFNVSCTFPHKKSSRTAFL